MPEKVEIEIDGMAFSDQGALIAERKPRISYDYVFELAAKAHRLE